ncbi:MAG TPA: TonB-dependent receptor, partial [Thermoanaerobaculia bacterium]|nr:TonB-dependent receptor [Thermoanaerobaculia bacterium]
NGSKSEANTFAKLTWDSGPWHAYGDAQLRWARFGFEGDLPLGSVSWTFFNPKVGVRRDLAKGLTAYASIGRTTREPARADMLGGQDNPTIPYDLSAVKPEKVTAVELGTEWRGRKVTALVSLYAMEFRDEIALTGELSEIGLPLRRNVEKSSRRGIEWDVTWRPASWVTARFTGNLNRSRISEWTQYYDLYDADFAWTGSTSRTYADVRPLMTPPFVGNLSIDWSPVRPVSVGASGRWVTRAHLDNTNVESLSAPSFFRLDASLALDLSGVVATGKPRLRLRVDNVLDERRSYPNGYSYLYAVEDGAGGEALAGTPYFFPLATRNVSVSLDLSF